GSWGGDRGVAAAGGPARRAGLRELSTLVTREFARRFHGRVAVNDAADPGLVEVPRPDGRPFRVHPALADTDAVVVVGAAETVLHGGPATLLADCAPDTARAPHASPLPQTAASAAR